MPGKKYFITGGAGFIGSNFIKFLRKRSSNLQIVNFDNLTYAGNLQNLKSIENDIHYSFVKGDICDPVFVDTIFKQFHPDYIVNFAAESHVDRSIENPDIFVRTNVLGVQNLLKTAEQYGIEKYIQISTDEVYGSLGKSGFFSEMTPLNPRSPYSASKAGADMLTQAYFHTFNLPMNITRCSNNYGPYQFPEKLIPLTIYNCLRGKKIPVYGDGLNIRDWIFVEDHCSAIDLVIHKGISGEIYNIGANNERSNIEIVKTIIKIVADLRPESGASEDLITYVEDRKGHDRRYAIESTKIQKILGWKAETGYIEGLTKTIQWYIDHDEWLDSVITTEYRKYYSDNYRKKGLF